MTLDGVALLLDTKIKLLNAFFSNKLNPVVEDIRHLADSILIIA